MKKPKEMPMFRFEYLNLIIIVFVSNYFGSLQKNILADAVIFFIVEFTLVGIEKHLLYYFYPFFENLHLVKTKVLSTN